MTMEEQYEYLTDALLTALDNALDEIPGEDVEARAIGGALGYLLRCVAESTDNPCAFLADFCARVLRASQSLRERGETPSC